MTDAEKRLAEAVGASQLEDIVGSYTRVRRLWNYALSLMEAETQPSETVKQITREFTKLVYEESDCPSGSPVRAFLTFLRKIIAKYDAGVVVASQREPTGLVEALEQVDEKLKLMAGCGMQSRAQVYRAEAREIIEAALAAHRGEQGKE